MTPQCDLNAIDLNAPIGAPNVPPAEWLNSKPEWASAAAPYPRMIMCGPETGRGFGYIASWNSTFVGTGGGLERFPRGAYDGFTNRPKVLALDAEGNTTKVMGSQIGFGHSPDTIDSVDELMMFHDQPERAQIVAQFGEDDYGPYYNFVAVSSMTGQNALTINNASFSIELGQRDADISNQRFAQGTRWTVYPSAFVAHEGFPMEEERLEVQASTIGGSTFYRATRKAPERIVLQATVEQDVSELQTQVNSLINTVAQGIGRQEDEELGITRINDRVNQLEQRIADLEQQIGDGDDEGELAEVVPLMMT